MDPVKALSNSVMALLLLAALFWGNCLSCPEARMPAHQCCHHSKPAPVHCQTQVMRHFVKAGTEIPVVLPSVSVVDTCIPAAVSQTTVLSVTTEDHAPPGASALRI